MKRPFFYFFITTILLCTVCSRGKDMPSTALALVNGEPITRGEFSKELSLLLRQSSAGGEKPGMEVKVELLNKLLEKKLISQEARSLGAAVSDTEVEGRIERIRRDYPGETFDKMIIDEYVNLDEWKGRVRNDLLIEKVIDQVIGPKAAAGEKETRDFYEAHADDYKVEEQVKARQILVDTEEKAREALKRLHREESFEKVAKEISLSPDREKGGDLGFFSRGQMPPEFDKVCFSLLPGAMSGIVRSPYGYHIFLVEERRKGRRLEFEDVRKKIMERISQEKREAAFDIWMKELKKKSRIIVETSLLKDL